MNVTFSHRISGLAVALLLAATIPPAVAFATGGQESPDQQAQAESRERSTRASRVEGVWDVTVTLRDCQTGAPIRAVRAMNMFIRGGTMTELSARSSPSLRTSSLGTWRYAGEQHYMAVFRFSRFNPDGSFAATQKVSRMIELAPDANAFAANALVELSDASDNVFQTGCATEIASRLE